MGKRVTERNEIIYRRMKKAEQEQQDASELKSTRASSSSSIEAHDRSVSLDSETSESDVPKKKKTKEKVPGQGRVTAEVYDMMYAAFCKKQSVSHVYQTCPVAKATAKRYVEKGCPSKGFPAIRDRWLRVQAQNNAQQDYDLLQARKDVQVSGRVLLTRIARRIAELDPSELEANALAKQLQTVQQILDRTFGAADATVRVEQDRFEHWSVDELLEFAKTGIVPEHSRAKDGVAG